MKKLTLLFLCLLILGACSNEPKAKKQYAEAKQLEQQEKYEEVMQAYKQILANFPKTETAKAILNDKEIEKIQDKIQARQNAMAEELYSEALELNKNKKYKDAIDVYNRILNSFPDTKSAEIIKSKDEIGNILFTAVKSYEGSDGKTFQKAMSDIAKGICNALGLSCEHKYSWYKQKLSDTTYLISLFDYSKDYAGKAITSQHKFIADISKDTLAGAGSSSCAFFHGGVAREIILRSPSDICSNKAKDAECDSYIGQNCKVSLFNKTAGEK